MAKPTIGRDRDGFTTLDGRRVYWPQNVDDAGVGTFLLPGETTIDSATMRSRTKEYYRQIRGGTRRDNPEIGRRALASAKAMLAESDPPSPQSPESGTQPADPPRYTRK